MANPQIENGHVDISNEIFDALARTRIPGEARQVLDFIFRKTYGWHKKEDAISLSQFEKGTGLKRSNVCQSIKRLIEMNIIYKGSSEKHTGSMELHTIGIQVYGFQKDFEKWRVVVKRIPSPQFHTKGSMEKGNLGVCNSIHTKETIQKKTNKRNMLFEKFYHVYPKKKARLDAEKAWKKINPDEDLLNKMLISIEKSKNSDDWIRDDGKYVPFPATWLNKRRWEDEIKEIEDPYKDFERIGENNG